MRLGLIGWYGHSNFGDDRMLYCIKRFFSDYNFLIADSWDDARARINELNQCDYILIGGGGLVLRNIGHYIDIIRDFKKPFGFIGISIEAYHRSMTDFFELVKQKADFLLVRDKQSKEYLQDHYKVILGPDLTFLYPFEVVNEVKEEICGFSLRDWYYWKAALLSRNYRAMRFFDKKFPWLANNYPFTRWDPNEAAEIVKKRFKNVLPLPFYFKSSTNNDKEVLSKYFGNVPSQFDIDLWKKIRYLIGMRYHSIIFATQCGIPFISLSYQPKNVSFCADMGLGKLSVDIYKMNELEDKIDYVNNHYQQIRDHLISYREKSIKEINYIFQAISRIIS